MFVPLLAWSICIFTPWFHQSLIIYYVLFTLVIFLGSTVDGKSGEDVLEAKWRVLDFD